MKNKQIAKEFVEIMSEIEHLKKTGIPRCSQCKKNMVNAIDTKTKKISKYLWKYDCECNPNKRIRLCRG